MNQISPNLSVGIRKAYYKAKQDWRQNKPDASERLCAAAELEFLMNSRPDMAVILEEVVTGRASNDTDKAHE